MSATDKLLVMLASTSGLHPDDKRTLAEARAELAALRSAVSRETERCARIAEDHFDLGKKIAAAIRATGKAAEERRSQP